MSYLKYVFVQQPCPKHSDALCADSSIVPTEQIHRLFLLAIQVEGHGLVLHTEGYPVPSETTPIFWLLPCRSSVAKSCYAPLSSQAN